MSFHTTIARLREAAAARVKGEAPETCRVQREDVRVALHVIDRLDSELRQAGVLTPGAIPTGGLARPELEEEMQQARTALASAPVAGDAQPSIMRFNPFAGLGMNPAPNGMYVRFEDHAAMLWRYAAPQASALAAEYARGRADGFDAAKVAPQASEAVRTALHDLVEVLQKRYFGRMPDEVQKAFDAARTALSAQPGARKKGGSDA